MKNLFAQCKKNISTAELQSAKEKKINDIPWDKKHLQPKEIKPK